MTKTLALYLPDGVTVAPATDFGSVNPGVTTATRSLLLKNTGTEVIPSIRARIDQASTADGEYKVTANAKALNGANQELLTTALAVNATLAVTESWTTPAGAAGSNDLGTLVFEYDQ